MNTDSSPSNADSDYYVVSHGQGGGLGTFIVDTPLALGRGDRVLVESPRGVELGTVLRSATVRQARLLSPGTSGTILRLLGPTDEQTLFTLKQQSKALFDKSNELIGAMGLSLAILDAEVLLDGRHAILYHVGAPTDALAPLLQTLESDFHLEVRLENIGGALTPDEEEHARCDKPDCGKESGGCTSCSTGGGCSSCGSGKVDMRAYFAHLREGMEDNKRKSLL